MTSPLSQFDQAQAASQFLLGRSPVRPRVGIVLGSGLGAFASQLQGSTAVPFADIPHFPTSTVAGHAGELVLGTAAGVPVAVLGGRVHAYEGYTANQIGFPTRVLGLLGCRTIIVTNASGAIDPALTPGSLVLLTDHINLSGINVAAGPNEPRFGTAPGAAERFFDMSDAYAPRLRALALQQAAELGIPLPTGIYLAVHGPSFETPAEIRAFRTLGASLVGMSTVHEVILARHMGLEVLGLSLVTNPAAGVSSEPVDHHAVLRIGELASRELVRLLQALLPRIDALPADHPQT